MGDSDNKWGGGGVSIGTIIQIIFAILFYADPCHKDSQKDCWTTIGGWQEWQVWLPMIIGSGILVLMCICGGIGLCCSKSGSPSRDPFPSYGSTSV